MSLPQLPQDKANHWVYGSVIFMVSMSVLDPLYALAIVFAAGILKEVYDLYHRDTHAPEVADALATIAGGLVCFVCTQL